ncbi:MAG: DNA mismatch repair protein MutS [Oscillospiraceae bacterium]|nr:DNA mismatch repair protein MutS [Oscillospiraceae bacterium]
MSEMTPMMAQYLEIKKGYKDAILFFRLGDFYEMFFDDAKIASKVLELTLTEKSFSKGKKAPMCGVPFHSAEPYIAKLVSGGYKVAICEQVEDPATAKGIVKRDVVRIVTKGSIIENSLLDESKNNYLAVIYMDESASALCFTDVSTGRLNLTCFDNSPSMENNIVNELGVFSPSEIVLSPACAERQTVCSFISKRIEASCEMPEESYFDLGDCARVFTEHFSREKADSFSFGQIPQAVIAVGATLKYLKNVQKNDLSNIRDVNYYSENQYMKLDYNTLRNLEILETMRDREKKGSLLWVLDKTKTSMGRRLLRTWLEKPLVNMVNIIRRHNAVNELYGNSVKLSQLTESLKNVFDMERLMTRVMYESANARDLNALRQTIENIPEIKISLSDCESLELKKQFTALDLLDDVRELIDASIVSEDIPFTVREGGMIRNGFSEELDELREIQKNGQRFVLDIERREQERTGIPKLRTGYNRVFGYYIEVTNSYKDLVPEDYVRKQTLANCERYITQELKDLESKILGAQERIVKLEYEIFCQIRSTVAAEYNRIQKTAEALAHIDVFCSLASVALERGYTMPVMTETTAIRISDGRHPVVEAVLDDAPFVPNDTYMDCEENRCAIITGPNMAGKSTYMRQVAIICLMAQIGSFVPARSAELSVVDSIFTRVGASDDLATGQSTFMVEMNEVSTILKNAGKRSLIILDEVGRGTSTFDGMSIARAVLEYIADKKKIGAKTLFSTHYHELTELEGQIEGVNNYNISVKKRGDNITFLRRIVRGRADGSYGIEVAKLAGIPNSVVSRARVILRELESGSSGQSPMHTVFADEEPQQDLQLSLGGTLDDEIIESIRNIDINTLTPIEALTTLHELIKKARRTNM